MRSPKISQAKALVRFSRYGAAQEAALEEIGFKQTENEVLGCFPGLGNYRSEFCFLARISRK
jgi:hypothetical protein